MLKYELNDLHINRLAVHTVLALTASDVMMCDVTSDELVELVESACQLQCSGEESVERNSLRERLLSRLDTVQDDEHSALTHTQSSLTGVTGDVLYSVELKLEVASIQMNQENVKCQMSL